MRGGYLVAELIDVDPVIVRGLAVEARGVASAVEATMPCAGLSSVVARVLPGGEAAVASGRVASYLAEVVAGVAGDVEGYASALDETASNFERVDQAVRSKFDRRAV